MPQRGLLVQTAFRRNAGRGGGEAEAGRVAVEFSFSRPEWVDEIGSTSDELKARLAVTDLASGTVLAARRQTRGRGRMGNGWLSSEKGDVTFSFYWRGAATPAAAGALPMACALGVRDFLAGYGVECGCKWPNDVMTERGKICGILAEGCARGGGEFGAVVGIGVNVRRAPGRDELLGRKTAALEDFCAGAPPAGALLEELLAPLAGWIGAWRGGGFAALADELEKCFWGRGREVVARIAGGGSVKGVACGLGPGGELVLDTGGGEKTLVSSVSALENWDG